MYDVIDFLQSKGKLLIGKAVTKEDIEKIEEQLGVSFANVWNVCFRAGTY